MRLEGTCRRGGNPIQPRCSNLSISVRAAMSLSWPTGLRQFQRVAKCWLKRRRLQSGCAANNWRTRSEEHTSELQSLRHLVCRLLLEKKKPKSMGHEQQ